MIVPVIAISNLVLTRQIYSEGTNGAHAHYREPVPLRIVKLIIFRGLVYICKTITPIRKFWKAFFFQALTAEGSETSFSMNRL